MVDTYPDAVFLDIGSNIGMYTVMIAAMDRKVFAVDPMIFNLQLIHESLKKSGKTKYVNLINSPISNERKTYIPVTPWDGNEGRTQLIPAEDLTPDHPYYNLVSGEPVQSISLQDLTNNIDAKIAVVKMDIEGLECTVLN